ncbi:MAG TPA: Vms1/Ankzf1 family peptidyl-tRNA hydrolase [Streptosporangiaceae bacterium]|nr:Vms1/Ankzf1 family peptidyl-tRNA hydrolase [Streptosporangiaceae bacterium]
MKAGTLRPLYDAFGAYASVYLDTDRRSPDAARAIGLRWREAREALTGAGAREDTLDAIASLIADADLAAPGRAVFARDGAVTGTIGLRTTPALPVAELAPLPHLRHALADVPAAVPHLRVSASRAGGEIIAYYGPDLRAASGPADGARLDRQEARRTGEITAESWPVHKTSVGGWSQARYQRSAERAWAENAKELAAQVTRAASQSRAEFVVLAGDVRARSLVIDRLAPGVRELVVVLEAEVPPDDPELAAVADATATRIAAEECERSLSRWRELADHDQAVAGVQATIAAVRDGQAGTVFLCDDAALGSIAWLGVEGTDLATSQAELAERGVLAPLAERADEAIIRAAASTDAELFIVPGELASEYAPKDGVCAALRYPLPAPG